MHVLAERGHSDILSLALQKGGERALTATDKVSSTLNPWIRVSKQTAIVSLFEV